MSRIYLLPPLLAAINALADAGHGIEMEPAGGGQFHTDQDIIIGVHHPAERAYVFKLRVRFSSNATTGNYSFSAVSSAVRQHLPGEFKTIKPVLDYVAANADEWAACANTKAAIDAMVV